LSFDGRNTTCSEALSLSFDALNTTCSITCILLDTHDQNN
jgi:hypothetical protein